MNGRYNEPLTLSIKIIVMSNPKPIESNDIVFFIYISHDLFFLVIINAFGFVEEQSVLDFPAQLGIMMGFALIPSIFLIIGALVMFYYSLDGPRWFAQKDEIIRIHEEKERAYLDYLEKKEIK